MTSNTPFPEFKTTGDEKHDPETYIEDMIDYCVMQNWYDISKESEAAKWTNHNSSIGKKSNVAANTSEANFNDNYEFR